MEKDDGPGLLERAREFADHLNPLPMLKKIGSDVDALRRVLGPGMEDVAMAQLNGHPIKVQPIRREDLGPAARGAATLAFPAATALETVIGGAVGAATGQPAPFRHAYEEGAFGPLARATGLDKRLDDLEESGHPYLAEAGRIAGTLATSGGLEVGIRRGAGAVRKALDVGEDVSQGIREGAEGIGAPERAASDVYAGERRQPPESYQTGRRVLAPPAPVDSKAVKLDRDAAVFRAQAARYRHADLTGQAKELVKKGAISEEDAARRITEADAELARHQAEARAAVERLAALEPLPARFVAGPEGVQDAADLVRPGEHLGRGEIRPRVDPRDAAAAEEERIARELEEGRAQQAEAAPRQRAANDEDLRLRERLGAMGLDYAGGVPPELVAALARTGAGAAAGGAVDAATGEDSSPWEGVLVGAGLANAHTLLRSLHGGDSRELATLGPVGEEIVRPEVNAAATTLDRPRARVEAPRPIPEHGAPVPPEVPTPAREVDPEAHVGSLARFALDPTGEDRLRQEVQRVVQADGLDPKQRVTWDETRATAERLGLSAEDVRRLQGPGAARLSGPELVATRNIVSGNIQKLGELYRRLETEPLTGEEADRLRQLAGSMESQNDALLSKFVRGRSDAGRTLNSLKILARDTLDPAAWYARAKQALGREPFTEAHGTEIRRLIHAGDRAGLASYVASLRQATLGEKGTTLWKAGLLTAPTTHAANILSNTTMAALETVKDAPAYLADVLLSKMTGMETKAPTVRGLFTASAEGAKKGVQEAREVMKGHGLAGALERYDVRETNFRNVFLDTYTKGIFRSLSAEDRVFRNIALRRSLAEQAELLARKEGLNGPARSARVEELLKAPTDEMALRAISDAEVATFQDNTKLSRALSGLKRPFGVAGDVLLPFTKTPGAVATRALEYSPLGYLGSGTDLVRLFRSATKGEAVPEIQKRAVERFGRATTGTAPILVGYLLAAHGRMTASLPTEQKERERWQLEGKQENAVLVGGKWRSVERTSPAGNLLALGAHLYQAAHEPEASALSVAASTAAAIGRTVKDQSFLKGLEDTEASLDDPNAAHRQLTSTVASAVPTIVGRAAHLVDPTVRETATMGEAVQSRIPFLSRQLPARVDAFGQPIERERGVVANLLDPFNSRPDRAASDPLLQEMEHVGAGVPRLKQREGEDRETFRQRQAVYGQWTRHALEGVVQSPEYRGADEVVRQMIDAHPELRGRDPQALAGEYRRHLLEDMVSRVRTDLTRLESRGYHIPLPEEVPASTAAGGKQ